MATRKPVVFIVGPTASGKTDLAVDLAQKYGGEIICADSRTVYKGLDIGTAKPSAEQTSLVPHWGLDLVEPNETYSAAKFKKYAEAKIKDIQSRGAIPFVVGGTGLYIDGLLFDYKFGSLPDEKLRKSLQSLTNEELIKYCTEHNIELPGNHNNTRHLIRAIEQGGINNRRNSAPKGNYIVVGITTDKDELNNNIIIRTNRMLNLGVLKEAEDSAKKYGWDCSPLSSNIYLYIGKFVQGDITRSEMVDLFVRSEKNLVKKQLTWFKRNKYTKWFDRVEAAKFLDTELAKVVVA